MKNLRLLAFCLMLLTYAAPMMPAAGSGQAQTALMPLAKTGNVISTSTSAPTISIVYSGSLTFTMTWNCNTDYLVKDEETCTITIPFSNLTLAEGPNSEPDTINGTLEATLSYTADWSVTPRNQSYQLSIDNPSGHTSGSFNVAVSGTCTLGPIDHVVFTFLPQDTPEGGDFPVNITVTDNRQQPPYVYSYQNWLIYPFPAAVYALSDANNNDKIYSQNPYVSQHITFNEVLSNQLGIDSQYIGDLALTVEGLQSAPLASVTGTSGTVETFKAQEGTWENAVVGTDLNNGDGVRTGSNSQAKVGFEMGGYIIAGSDSSLTVEGIQEPTVWNLLKGEYYFIVTFTQQWIIKKFEVRTPNSANAVRGTEFTVEVAEDNATTVTVLEGTVDVQDRISGSNASITANHTLTIPSVPGGLTPQEMSALITEVDPASVDRWWETSTPSPTPISLPVFLLRSLAGEAGVVVVLIVVVLIVVAVALRRRRKKARAEAPARTVSDARGEVATKAGKPYEPLKKVAKVAKHGWLFKMAIFLFILVIATNVIYYFGIFSLTSTLQPVQQVMDQTWSVPGLAQVHQAISQVVQDIQNRFTGSGNLSPARDLTGRWVDLQGEGLVVTPLAGPQRFHYDIMMDITQNGSTFTGTLWYRLWKVDALTSGYQPPTGPLPGPTYTVPVINGVVSGPSIQFEAINGWIWKATFTTDRISGNFTVYDSGVTYRMVLLLNRQW